MATIAAIPSAHADALPRQQSLFWQFVKSQPLGDHRLPRHPALRGVRVRRRLDLALRSRGHRLRRHAGRARHASTGSAPTSTAATSSRRIVYGARTALAVGILSAVVGCTVGALVGAVSGYFGGRIDNWIQRVVDIMLSFPIIVLAMVVVAVLGKRNVGGIDTNLIVAIALPIVPKMARVARASTLSIVAMPFIDAARAAGFSHSRIVLRHILPNIVAPYLILVTAFIAQAILLEASLSFLGLGVTEPTPAWGLMLSGASADFYQTAPWMILFPGLAITLAVFAFNLFGDSLRDWLDPKLKS